MELEVLTLSSSHLPEADRDEVIREYYGKIAQRMEIEPDDSQPFHIEVSAMPLPGLMVGRGTVSSMKAFRTPAMRADGASDIILSFQRQGAVTCDGGEELVVKPGEACLTALDRPISLFMPERANSFLTVQISRGALATRVAHVDDLLSRSLPLERPGLRLLEAYASSLSPKVLNTPQLRELAASHLLELAALVLRPTPGPQGPAGAGGLRAARLAAAKDMIAKNLGSPRLSAASVAAGVGVSQRYLHMLFANEPLSFAEFVSEQRLAGAMKMLTDPAQRGRRVLEIALQAGFGDVSTFNRAFRKRFGMTPSDSRVRSKAGG